jgi:hypothetical protein
VISDPIDALIERADAVAAEMNASVYVYSGPIDMLGYGKLLSAMEPSEDQPKTDNAVLLLTTSGGLANAAYQIARRFQEAYDRFTLVVPSFCKSAGTLVALGAHDLIMDDISELGPLDVQLLQRDEIGQRKSGMVVRTAFEGLADETFKLFERFMLGIKMGSGDLVSFDTASRIAAGMASGVMAPVYSQISPETLGNDLRDLRVAMAYGERLRRESENAKPNAIEMLVEGYPSHDFIIDRSECRLLFEQVSAPTHVMQELICALGRIVYAEQSPHFIHRWDGMKGEQRNEEREEPEHQSEAPDVDEGRKAKG